MTQFIHSELIPATADQYPRADCCSCERVSEIPVGWRRDSCSEKSRGHDIRLHIQPLAVLRSAQGHRRGVTISDTQPPHFYSMVVTVVVCVVYVCVGVGRMHICEWSVCMCVYWGVCVCICVCMSVYMCVTLPSPLFPQQAQADRTVYVDFPADSRVNIDLHPQASRYPITNCSGEKLDILPLQSQVLCVLSWVTPHLIPS